MSGIRANTKVLFLLCILSFLLYLDRVNLSTAAVVIQKQFNLTNLQLGVAFSAFGYSYLVTQIFGGLIADKIGPKVTLLACVSIWVISTVATGMVSGLITLVGARVLLGIGEGATLPASARAIANWFPPERRGFVQGITHSCSRFANAVAPPLIAFLISISSWRKSFVYVGIGTALWLVGWAWYFRDHPDEHPAMTEEELTALGKGVNITESKPKSVPWGPLLRRIAPTMLVYFCYGWTAWMYFTWMPTFFLHYFHLNIKDTAFFASGVFFAGVMGDALGGVLSDHILRRTRSLRLARSVFISGSFLASGLCLLPVFFTRQITVVLLALSGAFFFIEMVVAPVWVVPMDIAPEFAGTASGIINCGSALAGLVSPILFGYIVDMSDSWIAPFYGSVALLLGGALMACYIHPELTLNRLMANQDERRGRDIVAHANE